LETGADRRIVTIALALLLAWSLALRVWLATPRLDGSRFWDESYGVYNVYGLLARGQLRPLNGYHPGLSYLPQAALLGASEGLHRLTGRPAFAVIAGEKELTPTGYLLCRLVQALAGTLSLYLTFSIGRRLASPGVGLAAALFLALAPWHLRQSVIFKPDIELVACSLLALRASLAAADRPDGRTSLAAGAAVGLALAAKFNAAPAAVPLGIALLGGGGWRRGRRWGALALAAAAALAVFALLTPFLFSDPDLYTRDLAVTWSDYASKGARLGSSHAQVLVQGLRALLGEGFFGPFAGAAGLLGLVVAGAAPWLRRGEPSPARRLGPAMVAAYAAAYALLYAASTTNPSPHNWLPVAPCVALGAAWTLSRGWAWLRRLAVGGRFAVGASPAAGARLTVRSGLAGGARLAARLSRAAAPALGAAAFAAICLPATVADHAWVYQTAVPSTQELQRDLLRQRLAPLGRRVVVREADCDADWYRDPAIVDEVQRLAERSQEELELTDAELFPTARLQGGEGGFYRQRVASPGAEVVRVEPRLFHAHGSALAAILHPWAARGQPEPLALLPAGQQPRRFAARLGGDLRPGDVASLEIQLPPGSRPDRLRDLQVEGRSLLALMAGREAGSPRLVSERFTVGRPGGRAVLVLADDGSEAAPAATELTINLQRWGRPRAARAPSSRIELSRRLIGKQRE
jgi:Dolichyl-phosphate-mannose-protein mannosyltransferase